MLPKASRFHCIKDGNGKPSTLQVYFSNSARRLNSYYSTSRDARTQTFHLGRDGKGEIILVTVLNKNGYPLMPCSESKARRLLAQQKAKILKRNPFTIQLLYGSSGYTQKTDALSVPEKELPIREKRSFDDSCEDAVVLGPLNDEESSRTTRIQKHQTKSKRKGKTLCKFFLCISVLLVILIVAISFFHRPNPTSFNKEMYTVQNFIHTAGKASLRVVDAYEQYQNDASILNAYIAIKESDHQEKPLWKIEHYTMRDVQTAEMIFKQQLDLSKSTLSVKTKDVNLKETDNWQLCKIKTAYNYVYLLRIDNFLIMTNTKPEYESDVTVFMEMLNENN